LLHTHQDTKVERADPSLIGTRKDNPNEIEMLAGGQYAINKGDGVLCLITKAQRDPKVYGEDANEFRPERMMDENFAELPKGAYKPFGTGVRGCIGQAFVSTNLRTLAAACLVEKLALT
jgi:cytochrome P450 / NADPH-cytochrome P450 reductase